jgi:uncharacterized protein YjbI with pentapeptide repeats
MIKYPVLSAFIIDKVLFWAEIDAVESDDDSYKKRLAVIWALEHKISLADADLSKADLSCLNLSGFDLYDANLEKANCAKADFQRADLRFANLEGAIILGAIFYATDMRRAILDGHDLNAPEFKGAILDEGVKK